MSQLDPTNTTAQDLCIAALRTSGAFAKDQNPLASDIEDAQAHMQWMLQEWERKTWLVPTMVNIIKTSTGAVTYSVGPGGDFDTGVGTQRPAKLESGFLRQLVSSGGPPSQPVDFPLEIIQALPDYNRVTLKQLTSFTGAVYYQPNWLLGTAYPVPIPQASLYALGLAFLSSLPNAFTTPNAIFSLPYEYYRGIVFNTALAIRPGYGLGTYPGDMVPTVAKSTLNTIRSANIQVGRLTMPGALLRPGIYNILSDRSY